MSLVRIITGSEAIVRRTGGKRYIFKPVLTNTDQPVSPDTITDEDSASFSEILEKVLDLSNDMEPIDTNDNSVVDIINSVGEEAGSFSSELENAINKEWSKP